MIRDKYDWETRDDARTIRDYHEIKNNPARLKKAQDCLKESASVLNACIKDVPNSSSRHSNPATIGKLKVPN